MYFDTVATAALFLGAAFASVPEVDEDPLKGCIVESIEWEVQATPSGEMIKLNGTVKSVHEQLLAINPNYEAEFAALEPEQGVEHDEDLEATASGDLAKRTDFSTYKYECFGRWRGASPKYILQGIKYLRKLPGRPTNGPGPGACGRVSCSWNSAISWCNDTLASYGSIADGAAWIRAYCKSGGDIGNTAGQIFHATGWKVIVYNSGPCK